MLELSKNYAIFCEPVAELWTSKKKLLIVNFLPDDEVGFSNIGIIMAIHQN